MQLYVGNIDCNSCCISACWLGLWNFWNSRPRGTFLKGLMRDNIESFPKLGLPLGLFVFQGSWNVKTAKNWPHSPIHNPAIWNMRSLGYKKVYPNSH